MSMHLAKQNLKEAIDDCLTAVFKEAMNPDSVKNMTESDLNGIKTVLNIVFAAENFMNECVKHAENQEIKLDQLLSEIEELKSDIAKKS